MSTHWRKCSVRTYHCAYCDERIEGKQQFKNHVLDVHEQKFLSIFDKKLEGARVRKEVDYILSGIGFHQQIIECPSPQFSNEEEKEEEKKGNEQVQPIEESHDEANKEASQFHMVSGKSIETERFS